MSLLRTLAASSFVFALVYIGIEIWRANHSQEHEQQQYQHGYHQQRHRPNSESEEEDYSGRGQRYSDVELRRRRRQAGGNESGSGGRGDVEQRNRDVSRDPSANAPASSTTVLFENADAASASTLSTASGLTEYTTETVSPASSRDLEIPMIDMTADDDDFAFSDTTNNNDSQKESSLATSIMQGELRGTVGEATSPTFSYTSVSASNLEGTSSSMEAASPEPDMISFTTPIDTVPEAPGAIHEKNEVGISDVEMLSSYTSDTVTSPSFSYASFPEERLSPELPLLDIDMPIPSDSEQSPSHNGQALAHEAEPDRPTEQQIESTLLEASQYHSALSQPTSPSFSFTSVSEPRSPALASLPDLTSLQISASMSLASSVDSDEQGVSPDIPSIKSDNMSVTSPTLSYASLSLSEDGGFETDMESHATEDSWTVVDE
ncbi:hypothetical protein BC832DRAFT_85564 [Gaertneriomyces semiglobifer]|nr:hypothetical protein BC832DRAFT_85564 [Gaertneriomyces semiglobifer]